MAEIHVVDAKGKSKGSLQAADAIFAAPVKPHVVRLAVNAQLAARRSGSASTKNRGTIHGGGRKPFRQKGTGRARQGTIRAPHMRGGAIAFGPMPRSWRQRLNRKVKRQALTSVLSSLVSEGALRVIEDFGLKDPKTKGMVALLDKLGLGSERTMIILSELDRNVALSARNLPAVTVVSTEELSVYDLLLHDQVVATRGAIARIEELFASTAAVPVTEEAQS